MWISGYRAFYYLFTDYFRGYLCSFLFIFSETINIIKL